MDNKGKLLAGAVVGGGLLVGGYYLMQGAKGTGINLVKEVRLSISDETYGNETLKELIDHEDTEYVQLEIFGVPKEYRYYSIRKDTGEPRATNHKLLDGWKIQNLPITPLIEEDTSKEYLIFKLTADNPLINNYENYPYYRSEIPAYVNTDCMKIEFDGGIHDTIQSASCYLGYHPPDTEM